MDIESGAAKAAEIGVQAKFAKTHAAADAQKTLVALEGNVGGG